MEAREEQIVIKTTDKEISAAISSTKKHNPGLKALLSIKKNTAAFEKEYAELLQIEGEVDALNKNAFLIIEANALPGVTAGWKVVFEEEYNSITAIIETLSVAKEKLAKEEKYVYQDLWKQMADLIIGLKDNSQKTIDSGFEVLPEAVHPQWEKEYAEPEKPLMESLIAHVQSCRVMLQINERYSPDELDTLTQIIADHVPSDFTYEDALVYQIDYYKALVNFKNEFKTEKHLWDKFLDILAGGTHQLPSEGAMMERWLDGEEAEV